MVDPPGVLVSGPPRPSMPEDVKALYFEASEVARVSPRAAAALLRVAVETLVNGLQPGNRTLFQKIGDLVKGGLAAQVQQAMDMLRVTGNDAVHPVQTIVLESDEEAGLVPGLFEMLNFIVEQVVDRQAHIDRLFGQLPESARKVIEKRDSAP